MWAWLFQTPPHLISQQPAENGAVTHLGEHWNAATESAVPTSI